MYEVLEVIKNINTIYGDNNALAILKDFERVLDDLNLYVFANWQDGELVDGPIVERHWVTCEFMWPKKKMPDPEGARLIREHGCLIDFKKDYFISPRKIKNPDDYRPNTKKGKLDYHPVWVVRIQMPKKLILDVFRGYFNQVSNEVNAIKNSTNASLVTPEAEAQAQSPMGGMGEEPGMGIPGGMGPTGGMPPTPGM